MGAVLVLISTLMAASRASGLSGGASSSSVRT
jgi:hypothetical protein